MTLTFSKGVVSFNCSSNFLFYFGDYYGKSNSS